MSNTLSKAASGNRANRVRINVQLIDAATDRHIWAERYDRELEDIFAIQDELTASVVRSCPADRSRDPGARRA